MPVGQTLAPTQAAPARQIIITQFTSMDVYLGSKKFLFSNCGPAFIKTLRFVLENYIPKSFVILDPPISDSLSISGAVTLVNGRVNPDGSFKVMLTLSLQIDLVGGVYVTHGEAVATGDVANAQRDEWTIYGDLEQSIFQCLNGIVDEMVMLPNFIKAPWHSRVDQVTATSVGIACGAFDNIRVGNVFDIVRPIVGVIGGPVLGYVTTIQVDVVEIGQNRSTCSYWNDSPPSAKVEI